MHMVLIGTGSVGGLPGVAQWLRRWAWTGRSDFHRETVDRKRCSDCPFFWICLFSSSSSLRKDLQQEIPDDTAEKEFHLISPCDINVSTRECAHWYADWMNDIERDLKLSADFSSPMIWSFVESCHLPWLPWLPCLSFATRTDLPNASSATSPESSWDLNGFQGADHTDFECFEF